MFITTMNSIHIEILETLSQYFEIPIDKDTYFFDIGGTSQDANNIISRLNKQYNIRINMFHLFSGTIEDFIKHVITILKD